jgi:quinol monooxygenase YgiN
MIILAGTIRIAPGHKATALTLMAPMIAASRAEPGCVSYSFAFDALDDHLVWVFEIFTDEDALAFHRAAPHMAAWRAGWAAAGVGDRDMREYRVTAP